MMKSTITQSANQSQSNKWEIGTLYVCKSCGVVVLLTTVKDGKWGEGIIVGLTGSSATGSGAGQYKPGQSYYHGDRNNAVLFDGSVTISN